MAGDYATQQPQTNSDPTHFPADEVVERALLGKILLDGNLIGLEDVSLDDFHDSKHREIFRRMREDWGNGLPIDAYLIADRDGAMRHDLANIAVDAPSVALENPGTRASDYARRLRELSIKRKLMPVANRLMEMAMNGASPQDTLDFLADNLQEVQQKLPESSMFDRWEDQGINAAEAAKLGKVERDYVVQDLIRKKSVSIFYGAPGDFKSAVTMDMAFCIANGVDWLEPLPVEGNTQRSFTTSPSRVLWLNYDQAHDDIIERLGAMERVYGGGENVKAISQSTPNATLTTESQARALGKYCADNEYGVLIVDSLLDVKGKADLQEASMGDVLRLWRIVAETGDVSVIIIAHNTKVSLDLYGSQFIKAKLDHLYYVSRAPGTDVAIIESKKQRNFGEQAKLYAHWTYKHFDNTRTLERARFFGNSTGARTAHPNNTTQDAIKGILMASPGRGYSAAELTDLLNEDREDDDLLKMGTVRKAADRLVENDRSIGKTPIERGVFYHYGELNDGK